MRKYLKLAYTFRKLNIDSAMAYRASFWTAVISMVINDIVLIIVFYLLYQKFGTVWGIDFQWYLKLNVVVIWAYAMMTIPFFGVNKIADKIADGQLDSDLLLPKDLLLRIIMNGINVSAYGDFLFAVIALFFIKWVTMLFLAKLVFVSFFAGISFTGFMLIFQSLGFWLGSSREISKAILISILWPSLYPEKIFAWSFFAILFKTFIPVFFIIHLPYRMLTLDFSLINSLMLIGASIFFFGLWYTLFYKWLKRYESGNTININM